MSTQPVYFITVQRKAYLAFIPFVGILLPAESTYGQIVAAEDGTHTNVEAVGNHIEIQGGQHSSDHANVFHNFDQFNVTAEQTADFITDSAVQNVIGSVGGGDPSNIAGELQVSGSDANLYLMNPAGVLIDPEAQLN